MHIYKSIKPLINTINTLKRKGKRVGFIPTMGYLHEGHLSLIRQACKDTDTVIVSIYVNPTQFGKGEDLKKYPRDLNRDLVLCKKFGVDIIFIPNDNIMYTKDFSTYVNVNGLTDTLCGKSRPGHFKGVATVVTKLFNIVTPRVAYFGRKDMQQALVIKRMVKDLNMPIKIKLMPIVREKDGLAMSSRNKYLTDSERKSALSLYRSLKLAKRLYRKDEKSSKKIINKIKREILKEACAKIDYVSVVDIETLKETKKISGNVLVALAVYFGKTRLIDNVVLQ